MDYELRKVSSSTRLNPASDYLTCCLDSCPAAKTSVKSWWLVLVGHACAKTEPVTSLTLRFHDSMQAQAAYSTSTSTDCGTDSTGGDLWDVCYPQTSRMVLSKAKTLK